MHKHKASGIVITFNEYTHLKSQKLNKKTLKNIIARKDFWQLMPLGRIVLYEESVFSMFKCFLF